MDLEPPNPSFLREAEAPMDKFVSTGGNTYNNNNVKQVTFKMPVKQGSGFPSGGQNSLTGGAGQTPSKGGHAGHTVDTDEVMADPEDDHAGHTVDTDVVMADADN